MDSVHQKTIILPLLEKDLLKNSSVFLVNPDWWAQWCSYAGVDSETTGQKPSKIDNSPLLSGARLRDNLGPEDYKIVPSAVWERFLNWYTGGPEIEIFIYSRTLEFEVIWIEFSKEANYWEWRTIYIPRCIKPSSLKEHLCLKAGMEPDHSVISLVETTMLGDCRHNKIETEGTVSSNIENGSRILVGEAKVEDEGELLREVLRRSEYANKRVLSTGPSSSTEENKELETQIGGRRIEIIRRDREIVESRIEEVSAFPKVKLTFKSFSQASKGIKAVFEDFQVWKKSDYISKVP